MNRLAKFAALPGRRKILAVRCWFELNLIAVAIHLVPLTRLLNVLHTNSAAAYVNPRFSKDEIIWSVRAAAALSWHSTCAVRGLVAERLLRREGYPAQFRIGVALGQDFQAHAWVEDAGGILIGESDVPYHPLPDLSASDLVTPS